MMGWAGAGEGWRTEPFSALLRSELLVRFSYISTTSGDLGLLVGDLGRELLLDSGLIMTSSSLSELNEVKVVFELFFYLS